MARNKKVVVGTEETQNKLKNRVEEIYSSIKPIIWMEYTFGIFRFNLRDGKMEKPTWGMMLYSTFLLLLCLITFVVAIRLPENYTDQDTLMEYFDQVPLLVSLFHYMATMITTSYFFIRTNMHIGKLFAELDDELIKSPDFYIKDRTRNVQYLIIWFLLQSSAIILDVCIEQPTNIIQIVFFAVYVVEKLEIITFCVIIGMVKYRLTLINNFLSHFLVNKDSDGDTQKNSVFTLSSRSTTRSKFNLIGSPSDNNWKIRDLALMYDKIGTLCSLFNDVFNFQIFMTLVSTFICIVITIWTSLYFYKSPENNSGPLLSISVWCFMTVLVVAGMCFICEKLRLVRNSTKILVNQVIMDYDLPKTMRMQAKAFMELIEAWPLRILVYDMFSVDITLMLKFISVATTYLIVIIQISHFAN